MTRKDTALAVLFGVIAFGMVASRSFFVVGEATGGIEPGFHPTTEIIAESPQEAPAPSQVVLAGVPNPVVSVSKHRAPAGYVYWKTVRAKVTAYDPSRLSCGKFADGKTSIGQSAWVMDGVASDPKAIPYGTYVEIPGVGFKEVDDTGKAMRNSWKRHRNYHLDLRMTYPYQARRWGVKYLDVKLYRKAS